MDLQNALIEHLKFWGLRRFDSDEAYFHWQRETLGREILADLHRLVTAKQAPGAPPAAETAFYDRSADPRVLSVLYSQRYDYYLALAPLVTRQIAQGPAGGGQVLDCGCGIGILTTFWARLFPSCRFLGLDRSEASLTAARDKAKALGLTNLSFERLDLDRAPVPGSYDLVLAAQTLLQSEQDPGLASRSWETFERAGDEAAQAGFEARTGLGAKLDHLLPAVGPQGRLALFEKARQLARRVPLQRALAGRGWHLQEGPLPVRYRIVEEISDDGPFYVLGRRPADPALAWDETPEESEESVLYRCCGPAAELMYERLPGKVPSGDRRWLEPAGTSLRVEWGGAAGDLAYLSLTAGAPDGFRGILVGPRKPDSVLDRSMRRLLDASTASDKAKGIGAGALLAEIWPAACASEDRDHAPLYENHQPSAQQAWQDLPEKALRMQRTWDDPQAGQMHVELGEAGDLVYLYQASSFDQRQLVLIDRARGRLLEEYYQELVGGPPAGQARGASAQVAETSGLDQE